MMPVSHLAPLSLVLSSSKGALRQAQDERVVGWEF